jgi:hypothetical protein
MSKTDFIQRKKDKKFAYSLVRIPNVVPERTEEPSMAAEGSKTATDKEERPYSFVNMCDMND